MNARFLTSATLAFAFAGVLPARAADPQLLALVMPDAQVIAGVNVQQAKGTQFGQYILSQVQTSDPKFQELINLTGFDPTRDVVEVLVASSAAGSNIKQHSGLVLARGNFLPDKILAAAKAQGAVTESYGGATIIEEPGKSSGVAFLSSTIVVAGDIANVKAAIDRQTKAAALPSAVSVQINQWSNSQDAWAITTVPLSTLHPPANAPNVPGLNGQGAFLAVQQAAGGVRFGSNVVVTGQVQADTAQNATTMGDTLKLLANLAQMQTKDANAVALAQSLKVTANGNLMTATVSMPVDQLEQIVRPHASPRPVRPEARRK
jgi:hypothetical protein